MDVRVPYVQIPQANCLFTKQNSVMTMRWRKQLFQSFLSTQASSVSLVRDGSTFFPNELRKQRQINQRFKLCQLRSWGSHSGPDLSELVIVLFLLKSKIRTLWNVNRLLSLHSPHCQSCINDVTGWVKMAGVRPCLARLSNAGLNKLGPKVKKQQQNNNNNNKTAVGVFFMPFHPYR